MKTEAEIETEAKAQLFILIFFGSIFFIAVLLDRYWGKLDINECEITDWRENNLVEMTCKDGDIDDIKLMTKAKYLTNNNWSTFRDKNHCRLVKIDKTVSKNKNNWSCDNNLNISNDFYK